MGAAMLRCGGSLFFAVITIVALASPKVSGCPTGSTTVSDDYPAIVAEDLSELSGEIRASSFEVSEGVVVLVSDDLSILCLGDVLIRGELWVDGPAGADWHAPNIEISAGGHFELAPTGALIGASGGIGGDLASLPLAAGDGSSVLIEARTYIVRGRVVAGDGCAGGPGQHGGNGGDIIVNAVRVSTHPRPDPLTIDPSYHGYWLGAGGNGGPALPGQTGRNGGDAGDMIFGDSPVAESQGGEVVPGFGVHDSPSPANGGSDDCPDGADGETGYQVNGTSGGTGSAGPAGTWGDVNGKKGGTGGGGSSVTGEFGTNGKRGADCCPGPSGYGPGGKGGDAGSGSNGIGGAGGTGGPGGDGFFSGGLFVGRGGEGGDGGPGGDGSGGWAGFARDGGDGWPTGGAGGWKANFGLGGKGAPGVPGAGGMGVGGQAGYGDPGDEGNSANGLNWWNGAPGAVCEP